MGKNIEIIYLTEEVRIRKVNGLYFVETNTDKGETSEEINLNQLSSISKKLGLMVFEHFNPNHHDLKPMGF